MVRQLARVSLPYVYLVLQSALFQGSLQSYVLITCSVISRRYFSDGKDRRPNSEENINFCASKLGL